MLHRLHYLIVLSLLCAPLQAQDTSHINPGRLAIVAGVTAGAVTAIHLYQQHAWWQGSKGEFWFVNDWDYSRGVDKCGHMFGTFLTTRVFTFGLGWSGVERRQSVVYGAILGLGFELYVETLDGFHNEYGFSPGDAFVDIAGAAFPVAQEVFPILENFTLKWSYWPTSSYVDALKAGQAKAFIDDYEGQIYWLAIDPHFMLGRNISRFLPAWLGIAVGMGVADVEGGKYNGRAVFYVGLDYNLRRIQTTSEFLRTLFNLLDILHFPAPALKIDHGNLNFGLFFK
jgi:hypothetical protein